MYGLQEHEMRFYCLFKKVYFSLLATSDFFCRHAYAYAHMRIIRHESDMAAYAWPSLILMVGSHIFLNQLFKKLNFENKIDLGSFPEFQVLKAGAGGNATTGWHFEEIPGRNSIRNLLLGKLSIVSKLPVLMSAPFRSTSSLNTGGRILLLPHDLL